VDLSNDSASHTVRLLVPLRSYAYGRGGPGEVGDTYSLTVELPRNSSKRVVMYVPAEGLEDLHVAWEDGALKQPLTLTGGHLIGPADRFVVVLGGPAGYLSFLSGTAETASAPALSMAAGLRLPPSPPS